jgi:hypothetical protein
MLGGLSVAAAGPSRNGLVDGFHTVAVSAALLFLAAAAATVALPIAPYPRG